MKTLYTLVCLLFLIPCSIYSQCVEISTGTETEVFCPGDEITLTATEGFASYSWYYNFSDENIGGTLFETTGNSITLNASEWAVSYWYVEAEGCAEASPTVVWDSWVFAPIVVIQDGSTTICPGDSSMIEGPFGPVNFQWYRNGQPIEGASSGTYWVTQPGTYVLEASYAECPDFWLSSGVGPTFSFYTVNSLDITMVEENGVITLSIPSGTEPQWFLNDEAIENANELSYVALENGSYYVEFIDSNGCTATSTVLVLEALSAGEVENTSNFEVYPNPTADVINLLAKPENFSNWKIYDLTGKVVKAERLLAYTTTINLSDLGNGLYILELLNQDGENKVQRIVKL